MGIQAIVGGNWGDEGKGKMTDVLAAQADYVVRFQGGNNAGHTIVNPYGTFKLHLLPSGIFNNNTINVLATSVALNIEAFLAEYHSVIQAGVPAPNIKISNRAQIVLPHHILLDQLEEKRLEQYQFGSTQTGMSPFYADKYKKIGIQVSDLWDRDHLLGKVRRNLEATNVLLRHFYDHPIIEVTPLVDKLYALGQEIAPFVCDTQQLLLKAHQAEKNILFEGQLGALKDPDHGIYPMTTSSSPLAAFAPVSTGLPAAGLQKVTTVVKAYSSAVGAGAFISELQGEMAKTIREIGHEYGATTNRPRRIGWFDAVATRYGCQLQNTTEVVLSLLDVLSSLETIQVCSHYQLAGQVINYFPTTYELGNCKPIFTSFQGWQTDITAIRSYDDLPDKAKVYVEAIEEMIGFPIRYVSVGPQREALIKR